MMFLRPSFLPGPIKAAGLVALLAWPWAGCKREAAPPPTPPAGVAAAPRPDSAASQLSDPSSPARIAPSVPAFVVLSDTSLPQPTEENQEVPGDFYDSLASSLDSAEPGNGDATHPEPAEPDSAPGKILATGEFHGNEVPEDVERHEWLGAFIDSGTCRIQPTRIRIRRVPDPAGGGDDDTSGKEVSTRVEGKTDFLARDVQGLESGPCEALDSSGVSLWPGRRLAFRYRDAEYVLAVAMRRSIRVLSRDGYPLEVLRLFLTRKTPAGDTTAVILRQVQGHGVSLLRLGDFDRDGLPDLLLDDSSDHNTGATSLYLSRPAEPARMLKPVGSFLITGC